MRNTLKIGKSKFPKYAQLRAKWGLFGRAKLILENTVNLLSKKYLFRKVFNGTAGICWSKGCKVVVLQTLRIITSPSLGLRPSVMFAEQQIFFLDLIAYNFAAR